MYQINLYQYIRQFLLISCIFGIFQTIAAETDSRALALAGREPSDDFNGALSQSHSNVSVLSSYNQQVIPSIPEIKASNMIHDT